MTNLAPRDLPYDSPQRTTRGVFGRWEPSRVDGKQSHFVATQKPPLGWMPTDPLHLADFAARLGELVARDLIDFRTAYDLCRQQCADAAASPFCGTKMCWLVNDYTAVWDRMRDRAETSIAGEIWPMVEIRTPGDRIIDAALKRANFTMAHCEVVAICQSLVDKSLRGAQRGRA